VAETYNDLPLPLNPDAPREDLERLHSRILGFASECHIEADTAVKSTEGFSKIEQTMKAVTGVNIALRANGASHSAINEIGRLHEIMRAELTDVKPSAEFKTFNNQLQQHAVNYGRMWTSWYFSDGIDRKMSGVIDYALVGGSGYGHQVWNKFTRRIDVIPYPAGDVRPFRPLDNTIENCNGLFLTREMSVNAVKAMFPHKAKYIKQDRMGTAVKLQETTRSAVLDRAVGASPFHRAQEMAQPTESRVAGMPVIDLFYFYLTDPRINNTSKDVLIGDFDREGRPLNNYSYRVPPGRPLYPRKRLIIMTRACVLYDGPNIYWHGMFPVSKYTINPLPWSWLGHTPLWDCLPLQDTLNRGLRAMDDHIQKVLRPPVAGDRTSVNASELRAISTAIAGGGAHWLRNPVGEGVEVLKVEPLDPIVKDMMELATLKMAERCGVRDMSALLGLNQMPEGQTIDKLMFATKPETRSRSRMLELFYREQGKMFLYNAAQFITTREKFAVLGPDGMTVDEYDFDPSTFIPNSTGDPARRYDAANEHLRQFQFYVAPSSLLRTAQTQDQMLAVALFRDGALDIQSLLERLDWPNVPQVLDRLQAQQMQQAQMAAMAEGGAVEGGPPPFGGDPRGRPPSAQEDPQLRSDGYMSES
jgi:hypothetical protein